MEEEAFSLTISVAAPVTPHVGWRGQGVGKLKVNRMIDRKVN